MHIPSVNWINIFWIYFTSGFSCGSRAEKVIVPRKLGLHPSIRQKRASWCLLKEHVWVQKGFWGFDSCFWNFDRASSLLRKMVWKCKMSDKFSLGQNRVQEIENKVHIYKIHSLQHHLCKLNYGRFDNYNHHVELFIHRQC